MRRPLPKHWTFTIRLPNPVYWGIVYFLRLFHLREILRNRQDRKMFYREIMETWFPPDIGGPYDFNSVAELHKYEREHPLYKRV